MRLRLWNRLCGGVLACVLVYSGTLVALAPFRLGERFWFASSVLINPLAVWQILVAGRRLLRPHAIAVAGTAARGRRAYLIRTLIALALALYFSGRETVGIVFGRTAPAGFAVATFLDFLFVVAAFAFGLAVVLPRKCSGDASS